MQCPDLREGIVKTRLVKSKKILIGYIGERRGGIIGHRKVVTQLTP